MLVLCAIVNGLSLVLLKIVIAPYNASNLLVQKRQHLYKILFRIVLGLILCLLIAIVIMSAIGGSEWRLFWIWKYHEETQPEYITNLMIQVNLEVYLLSLIYYPIIFCAMKYKWSVTQE